MTNIMSSSLGDLDLRDCSAAKKQNRGNAPVRLAHDLSTLRNSITDSTISLQLIALPQTWLLSPFPNGVLYYRMLLISIQKVQGQHSSAVLHAGFPDRASVCI